MGPSPDVTVQWLRRMECIKYVKKYPTSSASLPSDTSFIRTKWRVWRVKGTEPRVTSDGRCFLVFLNICCFLFSLFFFIIIFISIFFSFTFSNSLSKKRKKRVECHSLGEKCYTVTLGRTPCYQWVGAINTWSLGDALRAMGEGLQVLVKQCCIDIF